MSLEQKNLPPIPDQETVNQWVKRDLEAAHYFLGLLLRYPDAIKKASEEIYKDIKLKENGALIDKVNGSSSN